MFTDWDPPIRLVIEQIAGHRLRDAVWAHLVESGRLEELDIRPESSETLIAELEELERTFEPPVPLRGRWPQMLTTDAASGAAYTLRDEALSRVVAEEMKRSDAVRAFRTAPEHELPADLLPWDEVEAWIFQTGAKGRGATWYLDDQPIPHELDSQVNDLFIKENFLQIPILDLHVDTGRKMLRRLHRANVMYGIPRERREKAYPVDAGSILDRLRQLSVDLAKWTGWSEAQATIWILAGHVPLIRSVSAEIEGHAQIPALSRIVLTIDPAVSPRELAEKYKEIRTHLIGERHRDLTEKHTMLALFSVRDGEGKPIAEAMRQWNADHPAWAYQRDTNFARDMRQARQRLLGIAAAERARVVRREGIQE